MQSIVNLWSHIRLVCERSSEPISLMKMLVIVSIELTILPPSVDRQMECHLLSGQVRSCVGSRLSSHLIFSLDHAVHRLWSIDTILFRITTHPTSTEIEHETQREYICRLTHHQEKYPTQYTAWHRGSYRYHIWKDMRQEHTNYRARELSHDRTE
jgi:hypothetical protein